MDIFNYIPVMIGVRAKDFSPVFSTKKVVDDLENVHKRLLVKLQKQGYPPSKKYTMASSYEDI